jgi:hypothetical protein
MSSVTCPSCFRSTPVLGRTADAPALCLFCRAPLPDSAAPQPAEAGEPVPAFDVHVFTGTPGGSAGGFAVALAVGLVGACVFGAIGAALREHIWFVIIFPALLGLAVGGFTGGGAWVGRYRNANGAHAAGFVAGLAASFAHFYAAFLLAGGDFPALGAFLEYMDLRFTIGTQIGSMNLGYVGSVIYTLVEVAFIVGCAAALAAWPVKRPFCGTCNAWKVPQPLGAFRLDAPTAVAAVAAGQPARMLVPGGPNDRVVVTLHACPKCGTSAGADVTVLGTQGTGEGAWSSTATLSYPADAVAEFERIRYACEEQRLVFEK